MMSNGRVTFWLLAFSIIWIETNIETVAAQAQLEKTLVLSLSLDKQTGERVAPSSNAIKAYITGGYVGRRPDLRFDYTDYRKVRKPTLLFSTQN